MASAVVGTAMAPSTMNVSARFPGNLNLANP